MGFHFSLRMGPTRVTVRRAPLQGALCCGERASSPKAAARLLPTAGSLGSFSGSRSPVRVARTSTHGPAPGTYSLHAARKPSHTEKAHVASEWPGL